MADLANRPLPPRRYLQRQWKRNKPHLPSSDSLPALRLCPNRPLFVCAQCGFANAWIPLCLWCEWTSAEATKQFEANLPRPRRLSAPPSRPIHMPKRAKGHPRRMSADSTVSSGGPHTQGTSSSTQSKSVSGIATILEAFRRDVYQGDHRLDPHNVETADRLVGHSVVSANSHRTQKEMMVDRGARRIIATSITPPHPLFSFPTVGPTGKPRGELREHDLEDRDLKREPWHHRKRRPALCVRPSLTSVGRGKPDSAGTTPAMDSVTSVLMDASGTSAGSMNMSDHGHMRSTSSISSSPCSPKRGLRRTKNMTLVPRGSSLSPRSRSPLRESVDIRPTSAAEARAPLFTPSDDHDMPLVRLGHPTRPYYSAIRKEMSRPTSPVLSIAAPRTPSPIPSQVDYVPRGTKSLDCGDRPGIQYAEEMRPMSVVLSGQATSPVARSGFSLSGEMEMRMNLARWRRENAPDAPGGYLFRETSRSPKMNVKWRVKQLGKGLKELVLGRS